MSDRTKNTVATAATAALVGVAFFLIFPAETVGSRVGIEQNTGKHDDTL